MTTPTLYATVNVQWEDNKGVERDVDVEVEYVFDGRKDLQVMAGDIIGEGEPYGISEDAFWDLVDQAVAARASDDYNNWLSGQDGSDD